MNDFAIEAPRAAVLSIHDSETVFPVRRVYCVGRNYAAHTVEMGGDPDREEPFFFQKNPDNLDQSGRFPYPTGTEDVHHEVELLVALGAGGTDISVSEAQAHVFGYAAALDMTRRDIQSTAKKAGRPWEMAKAFERSAPCGVLMPADQIDHPERGAITLHVNDTLRQSGDLSQMIWKVPEMIAYLSRLVELAPGDVILTGTPSGVGPVARGDVMTVEIEGVAGFKAEVV